MRSGWRVVGQKFTKKVWLFPCILLIVVGLLTFFRISGSSVGKYNQFFYGENYEDPDLLYGEPQSVRSDEWLVVTAMTAAQEHNNYNVSNPNIGLGQNMSFHGDVPQKDVWLLFEPQNWAFLVLPLEHAFALKWWLNGFLLMVSCYLFVLKLLPGRRLFASLMGLLLFFTPYVQWWYQTITMAPLYYTFFALTIALYLLEATNRKQQWLLGGMLVYVLACFALLQYPPFQIPCMLAGVLFLMGTVLERQGQLKPSRLRGVLLSWLTAVGVAGLLVIGYVVSKWDLIQTIGATEYPGNREPENYVFSVWHFLTGFLSGQLQDIKQAQAYLANQSEASGFILLTPFILLPAGYLVYKSLKKSEARQYTLLLLGILWCLFVVRYFVKVTGSSVLEQGLRTVQNYRMMLGIGLVGFLLMIVTAAKQARQQYPRSVIWLTTGLTFTVLVAAGLKISYVFPGFLDDKLKLALLVIAMTASMYCFLTRRITVAVGILLLLSVYSTYRINPLQRGLVPLTSSALAQKVVSIQNKQPGTWVMLHSLQFNTYLPANGIASYSGVYLYPQFELWQELDPTGKYKHIYNRYSQAIFSSNLGEPFYLVQPDTFHVKFDACSLFIQQRIDYVLLQSNPDAPCIRLLDQVVYPETTFYIAEIVPR